jgi:outer membrane protein TolC
MTETLGLLEDFQTIAKSMYSAGTGRQADVLRASVEVARIEAELERLGALRKGTEARLNSLAGRPADTPVASTEMEPLPLTLPEHPTLMEWALESRPLLQGMRLEVERAASRRTLAARAIWPDLTLGLQYGLGRMEGDRRSMGGASVGFTLPVHAGKRQLKLRDEAEALERAARARLEDAASMVDSGVFQALAELDRARSLFQLYREEILPQARATVESSLASYRVGSVDFLTLVDSQMALNRFEGELFDFLAAYGTALAQLESTIGRDIPVDGDLLSEDQ